MTTRCLIGVVVFAACACALRATAQADIEASMTAMTRVVRNARRAVERRLTVRITIGGPGMLELQTYHNPDPVLNQRCTTAATACRKPLLHYFLQVLQATLVRPGDEPDHACIIVRFGRGRARV